MSLRPQAPSVDEVVVVGRARGADPDGSVADRFLTRDELRNAPGSGCDVMRALVGLPGIVSSGEFASFSVRGHGPKNNLCLVRLSSCASRSCASSISSPGSSRNPNGEF